MNAIVDALTAMGPMYAVALIIAGVIAGFINTLAGGGSMLTLPALMMLGMPADIANATNRVGVVMQSIAGTKGFADNNQLDSGAILPVMMPTLVGGILGALMASYLPVALLKPVLLGTMVGMALFMVFKPGAVAPPPGSKAYGLREKPGAALALFAAGVYGGFVQAGVGLILLAALAGSLRYDLVRANALKVVCTGAFSLLALGVFVIRGQVLWVPGLLLAVGTMTGASLSVKFALNVDQKVLRWLLFVMVLLTCAGALLS